MDPKAFLGRGWTYPVQADATGADVALSEHEEDVRQAVRIILETNRGERVMRPGFGAGLGDFVFEPLSTTTYALIRQRVEEALVTWEPRIHLERVDVAAAAAQRGRVNIEIDYRVRATNTFYNLVYPFYLQEGAA
jgi:phage baseplate assembly protein W